MKKNIFILFIFCALFFSGCSIPASSKYNYIYSFTKTEKTEKGMFGFKKKIVTIKDFRENEMYDEDIAALKEEVEKYISSHDGLSEQKKADLRELKVTEGDTKEEVFLLLGEPEKISGAGAGKETWIYRINRLRAFTFFIFPYYFAHEAYYLRFENNKLMSIERHYPKQMVHQASGPGIL